tara:strand:- start:601 stop:1047 length:447 start_codon:yes stop_codon:yes gene_type:complete
VDPISAIGVAQAAYAAICAGFKHGRELESMAKDVGRWMGAINDVKSAHEDAKRKKFGSVEEEALQTYAALKKAEKMEAELKNFLIANYGFNAWNDVLRIQGELRKARLAERRRRERQIEDAMTYVSIVILTGLIGGLLFFIGYLIFGT